MGAFDLNNEENTRRRTAEALEEIARKLEVLTSIKEELREIKENIKHAVKMDNA